MKILIDFKLLKKNRDDLKKELGEDLFNVELDKPCKISRLDLIEVIQKYIHNEINQNTLLDWVNIIWFTDLYEYSDKDSDSIASVMTCLEELDEDGVDYTTEQFENMIKCLLNNKVFSF